jgi:serine/threonine protein kinase
MIDVKGGIRIMDMGISKSLKSKSQTLTGSVMGTPHFMSLEQATAETEIDCRADIYSLGATMFNAVTGRVAYDSDTSMGILAKLMTDPVPSAREWNPAVSSSCDALLMKMMAKDRDNRYQNWDEVIRDIKQIQKGVPIAAFSINKAADINDSKKKRTEAVLLGASRNYKSNQPTGQQVRKTTTSKGTGLSVKINCKCGQPLLLLTTQPGETIECRMCGNKITVPEKPEDIKAFIDANSGKASAKSANDPAVSSLTGVENKKETTIRHLEKKSDIKISGMRVCPGCGISNPKNARVCRECNMDLRKKKPEGITGVFKRIIDKICYEDED